jgi:hypothetical protein
MGPAIRAKNISAYRRKSTASSASAGYRYHWYFVTRPERSALSARSTTVQPVVLIR